MFEAGQRVIVTTTKDAGPFQSEFVHVGGTVVDSNHETVTYREADSGEVATADLHNVVLEEPEHAYFP